MGFMMNARKLYNAPESGLDLQLVEIINNLNTKSPLAGPGSSQAFATGILAATGLTFNGGAISPNASANSFNVDASSNVLIGISTPTIAGTKFEVTNSVCIFPANLSSPSSNNALAAVIKAGSMTSGRSIAVTGTVSTGGADYAEYERKSDGCNSVAKGQIVGFDVNGHITDKWIEAISFGVKTTAPSFIGGDTWGNEDIIGKRPEQPADDAKQSIKELYIINLALFESRLEVERQKVDRIAYSGKVPCNSEPNVFVGGYVIAVEGQTGNISGKIITKNDMKSDMTQYLDAVGRIRCILPDGRPEIAVITH